jgi:phosphomannomutase
VSGTRIASISGLRGIVGDGLDPSSVVEFAAAYASGCGAGTIVVAHDGRPTAPLFRLAVLAGVMATGRDVLDLGPAATPTVGFIVRERGAAGGIQISASHNPPEYNGLKFFQTAGMVLGPEAGKELLARLDRREFDWAPWNGLGRVHDAADEFDVQIDHLVRVSETINVEAIRSRGFHVVLDACHGAGSTLGRPFLDGLAAEYVVLGGEPDGRYDHPPEPTEANLRDLAGTIAGLKADVGFAQDPDADRLAIIDETGRYIGEELTLALATRHVLSRTPGNVVINLSTSRVVEDVAAKYGCRVERTPVGEIHVVTRMREIGAILGGEGNGGVIDPRVGYVRDSFVGMALVLDLMAATGEPLSKLVDDLPRYVMVKEKYAVAAGAPPIAQLFEKIADAHPDARADHRDGLRLDWHDSWVHVRASNTEPIVRVISEAPDRRQAEALAKSVGRWVAEA